MSRKYWKNQENRQLRRAEDAALRGDRPHPPYGDDRVPVMDAPSNGPRRGGKGCKRNKGGNHVIVSWPSEPTYKLVLNEETGRYKPELIPWRYHPPYRCEKCGKGFYSIPKRRAVAKSSAQVAQREAEDLNPRDHWSLFNIRLRLLGLSCRCQDCKPRPLFS